ncbi:MAG: LytR C-terminal domain-containing protein [Bacteroidota bacterium]
MSEARRLSSFLLNAGLAVAVVLVLVLLYAFAARALSPDAQPVRRASAGGQPADIIQVEVLNGCGATGIAGQATQFLRARDVDVVGSGNYADFGQEHSLVIDRVGNREAALRVAALLGIGDAHVRSEPGDGYYLDASVVLGRDYETLHAFADQP